MRQRTLPLVISLLALFAYACGGGGGGSNPVGGSDGGGGGSAQVDTTPPVVTSNLDAGSYEDAQIVILASDGQATIYYTLDGSEPTATPSNLYSGPIEITESAILRFMAVDAAGNRSGVVAVAYTIENPLSLTLVNARSVAEGAVRATSALNDLAFLRRQVLAGVVETQPGRLAGLSGSSARAIGRLLERAALLTAEQALDCDSGTATIRADAADPQHLLSPGDSGSITYNDCVVDQTTLGGSVSFAVIRNQNFPALPFELEIAYTIGNLSAAELGFSKIIQGRFTMVARSAEGQAFETLVEGGPVTWDEGVAGARTLTTLADFSATTTQDGATGGYRVAVNRATLVVSGAAVERTITFATTEPFRGTGDNPPQAGELLVAGDASNLRIVQMENSPTVDLWVDTDGDGRWEGEPTRTTWTELGW